MTETPTTFREKADDQAPSGKGRWLDVAVLWVAAVAAQALVLFMLMLYQDHFWQTIKSRAIASMLEDGRISDARRLASGRDYLDYPIEPLVQFALIGLAVIALAWAGRRALALALPFFVGLISMSPSFTESSHLSPKPISELGDNALWQMFSMSSIGGYLHEVWPLLLGLVVQTVLLLLPLVAAPRRRAAVPLMSAARTAALPTFAVTVVALATLDYSDPNELYLMPLVALTIGLLSGAIVTGTGSMWVRLPVAVGVPAVLGVVVMPISLSGAASDTGTGFGVAVAALIIAIGTASASSIHQWFAGLRHSDPALPASA